MVDVHLQPKPPPAQAESQAGDAVGQVRVERQHALVVTQATEAGDQGGPCPGERGHVQAVAGVVVKVAQVDERGLIGVIVRQFEVPDLRAHHRLGARRQR